MFRGSAIITKITTMADRSVRLQVDTQEASKEEMTELFALSNEFVNYAFAPSEVEIKEEDVPDVKPEFKGDKSPSQRLRARMFVYYKDKNKTEEGFQMWYSNALDEIGDKYLSKVD